MDITDGQGGSDCLQLVSVVPRGLPPFESLIQYSSLPVLWSTRNSGGSPYLDETIAATVETNFLPSSQAWHEKLFCKSRCSTVSSFVLLSQRHGGFSTLFSYISRTMRAGSWLWLHSQSSKLIPVWKDWVKPKPTFRQLLNDASIRLWYYKASPHLLYALCGHFRDRLRRRRRARLRFHKNSSYVPVMLWTVLSNSWRVWRSLHYLQKSASALITHSKWS